MAAVYITEKAAQLADSRVLLVALDWAKAFDSIAPDRLIWALKRFGLPDKFVEAVQGIYVNRQFFVREAGAESNLHPQMSGIVQGCPLSPFLFSMAMTCLMTDAQEATAAGSEGSSHDRMASTILYADDTLLVESSLHAAQVFMDAVRQAGATYGLKLNESKLEVLTVGQDGGLITATGQTIKNKDAMVYLGSLLAADGRICSELGRRIGAADAVFNDLVRVWRHADISRDQKIHIYKACVISKLLYGLQTAWIIETEKKRLDGFHCRCLRRIAGIRPAYYSRVSNDEVLRQTAERPLRTYLLDQQLQLYGHVARKHESDPLRRAVLDPASVRPLGHEGARRRGRPRFQWNKEFIEKPFVPQDQ